MSRVGFAAILIVAATFVAYGNSFSGPFVFDDLLSIRDNPTITGSFWQALFPPSGQGLTVEGRPLLNLSFALNHALSGQAVGGYHFLNLLIHVVAALALFVVVRRTLALPSFGPEQQRLALPIALATTLAWALHPVQTESVTYLVQRAESLMGMWFLLTFLGFVHWATGGGTRWLLLTLVACYAAALSKEVAAAIPVLVLVYDRSFLAGSFTAAWRARGRGHAALFGSWIIIGLLVARSGSRGGTVGFGSNVAWLDYAWTQVDAIGVYLRLVVWPAPLIFDYGVAWVQPGWSVLPPALLVVGLVAGTLVALVRWPKWGFLGLWFFAMLAPTSLVPGNRQTIAEHRIYLSLAAPIVAAMIGLFRQVGVRRASLLVGGVVVACALLVARRNLDYRSDVTLFVDTAAKRPGNAFAHYNLGKALAESGEPGRAVAAYEAALRQDPAMVVAHYNLGNAYAELGRPADAAAAYERALALHPQHVQARYNLGNVFLALGRRELARDAFIAALEVDPGFVDARANLAGVLLELGELDRAQAELEAVLRGGGGSAIARFNLAQVHRLKGRPAEARAELERILRNDPGFEPARALLRETGGSEGGIR